MDDRKRQSYPVGDMDMVKLSQEESLKFFSLEKTAQRQSPLINVGINKVQSGSLQTDLSEETENGRCISASSRNVNGSFNHGTTTRTKPIDQCTHLLVPTTTWHNRTGATVVGQYHGRISTRVSITENDSPFSTNPSCSYEPATRADP